MINIQEVTEEFKTENPLTLSIKYGIGLGIVTIILNDISLSTMVYWDGGSLIGYYEGKCLHSYTTLDRLQKTLQDDAAVADSPVETKNHNPKEMFTMKDNVFYLLADQLCKKLALSRQTLEVVVKSYLSEGHVLFLGNIGFGVSNKDFINTISMVAGARFMMERTGDKKYNWKRMMSYIKSELTTGKMLTQGQVQSLVNVFCGYEEVPTEFSDNQIELLEDSDASKNKKLTSFRLSSKTNRELDEIAEYFGVDRSEALRRAVALTKQFTKHAAADGKIYLNDREIIII